MFERNQQLRSIDDLSDSKAFVTTAFSIKTAAVQIECAVLVVPVKRQKSQLTWPVFLRQASM